MDRSKGVLYLLAVGADAEFTAGENIICEQAEAFACACCVICHSLENEEL